jgi:hypothetical protein
MNEGPLAERSKQARTTAFVVRVFSLTIILTVSYSSAVSKLRRPFLSDRYFFITLPCACFLGVRS